MKTISYNNDFAGWAFQQAELMRAGKLDSLDIANLIEEMECMGRSEHREFESRLVVLIGHLLKWKFQPEAGTAAERRCPKARETGPGNSPVSLISCGRRYISTMRTPFIGGAQNILRALIFMDAANPMKILISLSGL